MKKLLGIAIILFSINSFADDNQSLHEYMTKYYNWEKDSSHIVHVGTRCATLMDTAVWRLSADIREHVKPIAEQYKFFGDVYMHSTALLAEKINYQSDGYTKLYKSWMDSYKAMADENHIKYNDFFHGMLGEDLETCMEPKNFQFFKGLLGNAAKKTIKEITI